MFSKQLNRINNIYRLKEILRVLIKYGLADFINEALVKNLDIKGRLFLSKEKRDKQVINNKKKPMPVRVRLALEELGPTFVKLGQMLSTRVDIVPPEYILELSKLQSEVKPFSYLDAKEIVETELGDSLEKIFKDFKKKPAASASLSQIHKAKLFSGEKVAVKVQRPGIEKMIRSDLQILHEIARLIEISYSEAYLYQPVEIVNEFEASILKEVDFIHESHNLRIFSNNFSHYPKVKIPATYPDLTTKKVLVEEFIEGESIVLASEELETEERQEVARMCAKTFLEQVFTHSFFHADPHPGNIWYHEGKVIFLDLGMIGRISDQDRNFLLNVIQAVIAKDTTKIMRTLERMHIINEQMDKRFISLEITEMIEIYYNLPLNEIRIEDVMNRLLDIMRSNKIRLPTNLVMLMKALITMEGIVRKVDPAINLVEEAKPFVKKAFLRKYEPEKIGKLLFDSSEEALQVMQALPDIIYSGNEFFKKGDINLVIKHEKTDKVVHSFRRIANLMSFSLIISALILGSSVIMFLDKPPQLWGYSFLGFLGYFLTVVMSLIFAYTLFKK
jgi:ubiquinone biosynthesis protein